jgi:hypothetical protein
MMKKPLPLILLSAAALASGGGGPGPGVPTPTPFRALNSTSFNDLLTGLNSQTGGFFGGLTIFLVWMIIFGYTSRYGFNRAFATASFISFVVTLPLYGLGVVSAYVLVIFMVAALVGVFIVSR